MHIAYLTNSEIPSRSANSLQVMRMCDALCKNGHRVTLYARAGDASIDDVASHYGTANRVDVVTCAVSSVKTLVKPLHGWRVGRAVRRRPLPDLFYSRDPYALACVAGLGRPLVLEVHGPVRWRMGRWLQAWLTRRRNFMRLVVISNGLKRACRSMLPWLHPSDIVVAHDGVDLDNDAAPVAADTRSDDAGAPPCGRLRVAYIGHLYPGKGMEIVVPLAWRLPEHDFHVVGGTEKDLAHWRREASDVRNLTFHGFLPPSRLAEVRASMDVFLAPYQMYIGRAGGGVAEGKPRWMSPLKMFEYMAARRPIIASNFAVLREVLTHGVNAWLVPAADVDAWVQAVRILADDPALRRRLAEQAYQDVVAKYTWEQRARRVLEGLEGMDT